MSALTVYLDVRTSISCLNEQVAVFAISLHSELLLHS